jgi:hypothetical protein
MRVQHICVVGKEAIELDGTVRDGLTNTSHQNILHTRYRVAINSKVDLLLSAKVHRGFWSRITIILRRVIITCWREKSDILWCVSEKQLNTMYTV